MQHKHTARINSPVEFLYRLAETGCETDIDVFEPVVLDYSHTVTVQDGSVYVRVEQGEASAYVPDYMLTVVDNA